MVINKNLFKILFSLVIKGQARDRSKSFSLLAVAALTGKPIQFTTVSSKFQGIGAIDS